MYYRRRRRHKTGDFTCSRQLLENQVYKWPIIAKMHFLLYTLKSWRMHFRDWKLFTVTSGNLSFLVTQSTESAFYVDTALKLTECTTDIIKQVILAVVGKFRKSSVPVTHNRQSAESTADIKVKGDFSCSQDLLESRFPVTRIGENAFSFVYRKNMKDGLRRSKSS